MNLAERESHHPGKVTGLLRKMVELHQTGGLRLDRTLFGLAEKVDGDRRRGAGAGSPPIQPSGASPQTPT